ncbi:hypothetical protein HQ563_10955 [bacterium]|nr:hypothetical protein [bacterium]
MRFGWITALMDLPAVLDIMVKITALLALGWVVHFALRRRNPRWRVLLWRGVIAGVVVLPILGLVLPELQLRVASPTETEPALAPIQRGSVRVAIAASFGDDHFGLAPLPATQAESPAHSKPSSTSPPGIGAMEWVRAHYGHLLGSAWAVVAVVLILFAVKAHNRSRRIVKSSRPAPNWARVMLKRVAADLQCRQNVPLRCSAEVCSPLLTGILKPSIMLPQSMVGEDSAADLEAVLAHELTHLRSRDLLWSRFIQSVSVILWFHPLVWRIRAAHSTSCEQVCDAVAAHYVGDSEVYSGTLARVALGVLSQRRALAGIPMARRPQIGRRLAMLKKKIWASEVQRRSAVVLLLTGSILVVGLAGLKLTRADNGSAYASARATSRRELAEPREAGSRVVHFPRDRSLGKLKTKDTTTDQPVSALDFGRAEYEGWDYLGQAKGDVTVPAGKRLGLWVDSTALNDLSGLRYLGPNDLYILWLPGGGERGSRPDDRCMAHIGGLTGLKVLMLTNSDVSHLGLARVRGLKWLTKLYLKSERLNDAGLAHLSEMISLRILEVMSPQITDAGLTHLAKLRSLSELYVWAPKVRGPGLVHLAKLPSLINLSLAGNHFGDDGLKYLKNIPSVTKLSLEGILNLSDAGMKHVGNFVQLTDLSLGHTSISGKGLAHLSTLTKLESLRLYNVLIGDEGCVHLKRLNSLKSLNLWTRTSKKPQITDKGLAHLKDIQSLERLELSSPEITDKGLAHVAELSRLTFLRFSGGPITDAGISHLAKLRALQTLSIRGAGITDMGMSHIGKLSGLKDLFLLSAPQVTNQGLAELKSLKSLRKLHLGYGLDISVAGLAHLNAIPALVQLRVGNVRQDNSGLNLAGLSKLEDLSLFLRRKETLRDEDLACLARLGRLKQLQLGPHESAIGDAGFKYLAGLTSLEFLNVGGRRITDRGLRYLANMRNLWHLRLRGDFTDQGLRYLEGLEGLSILSLTSENAFSKRALNRLRNSLPSLQTFNVVP